MVLSDSEAEQAYRRYFPLLRAKCARMLTDPAEAQDVAQEAFTRLWESRKHIDDPAAVVSWLYRTGTRLGIDRLRRRARVSLMDEEQVEDLRDGGASEGEGEQAGSGLDRSGPSPERQAHARRELTKLLKCLRDRELEVMVLTHVDGLTQEEVAEVMGMSARHVRRVLTAAEERVARFRARSTEAA